MDAHSKSRLRLKARLFYSLSARKRVDAEVTSSEGLNLALELGMLELRDYKSIS